LIQFYKTFNGIKIAVYYDIGIPFGVIIIALAGFDKRDWSEVEIIID
jgi:hypothetical protein